MTSKRPLNIFAIPCGKPFSFLPISVVLFILFIIFNTCEKPARVLNISTLEVIPDDISFTTAILKGEISDLGSVPIEDHGILVSENSTPRIGNAQVMSLGKRSSRGSFEVIAQNLRINTTYFFRAFVSANGEDIYANSIRQFVTRTCDFASVITNGVLNVTTSTAVCTGNVVADGGAPITARGVCWSTSVNPTIFSDTTINGNGIGAFEGIITGLTDNTTYHVRAYAINAAGPAYSEDIPFVTTGVPAVLTSEITLITQTTASAGGNVTSDRGSPVIDRGVCWSTEPNPTTDNLHTVNGTGTGIFTSSITDLTSGTTYHVRAYATNSVGTGYGEDISFATLGKPEVITSPVTSVTGVSAASGGNVIYDGGTNVTARGVCWAQTANPTTSNSKTTNGTGTGPYSSSITGLSPGTVYHVRAYATNSVGTSYGDDIMFETANKPVVITASVSSVTSHSAVSGGEVISEEGAEVIAKGICWGKTVNPTISGLHSTDGTGPGPFISTMEELTAGTTYHVRAYATNSVGTSYGTDLIFKTLSIPVLNTLEVHSITPESAISGGEITYEGGTPVTARGVCWNTTGNPTIFDNKTSDGQGPGVFESEITGLTQTTTYFVRAWATNSVGTAYGNEQSFITGFLCGTNFIDKRDDQSYWTTKIGNQCWFAENLNIGIRIDGSLEQTNNAVIEKYCYDNDDAFCELYGGLYQWNEMMQYTTSEPARGLCPVGWHIPSDNEWKILEMELGMTPEQANATGWRGTTEGGAMKAKGTYYWDAPNEGATNSSLFTALPSGNRTSTGVFDGEGSFTDWWTSTSLIGLQCLYRLLDATHSQVYRVDGNKNYATPIRCVRDQ